MGCNSVADALYLYLFCINTLRPRQNGRHFPDNIFKCNENTWISIKTSLKFVPKGPIDNIPALVQIMAWPRPGDKPLSEPMVFRLPTHICVTIELQLALCSQTHVAKDGSPLEFHSSSLFWRDGHPKNPDIPCHLPSDGTHVYQNCGRQMIIEKKKPLFGINS